MVFGFFDSAQSKEAKLKEERELQEKLIAEQLKALQMEHEYQQQNMTQKGLINQHQRQQLEEKKKEIEAAAAAAAAAKQPVTSNGNSGGDDTSNSSKKNKPPGPTQKLAQHMKMARKGYEQLVHAIVRPPRASYKMSHLGPAHFTFLGRRFVRKDTTLLTERGYRIECSHWKLDEMNDDTAQKEQAHKTVVVYMHGNASARVEVLQQLSYLLSLGTSVFSFDFAGSGMSDGDYVSLGYYEREDLATVVAHLRATMGSDIRIALWGRSMGAATALMYASREATLPIQNVVCLVLDSSFCDLVQLAEEMVDKAREQGIGVPNVVVSVALAAIGWSVQNKAQFDIKNISPLSHAPHIDIPALVVCGEQDDFIKPYHSEKICEKYKGSKNLLMVEGDHNDLRPPVLFEAATQFLNKHLVGASASSRRLEVPSGLNLQTAPWQHKNDPKVFQAHYPPATLRHSESSNVSTVDATEMGMTRERQDAIQSSLVTMLGHEGENHEEAGKPKAAAASSPLSLKGQGEEIILEEESP